MRLNCLTADVKNKLGLHQGVDRNSFSYGKAMTMYLLMKQVSVFWSLTGPVNIGLMYWVAGNPVLKNSIFILKKN